MWGAPCFMHSANFIRNSIKIIQRVWGFEMEIWVWKRSWSERWWPQEHSAKLNAKTFGLVDLSHFSNIQGQKIETSRDPMNWEIRDAGANILQGEDRAVGDLKEKKAKICEKSGKLRIYAYILKTKNCDFQSEGQLGRDKWQNKYDRWPLPQEGQRIDCENLNILESWGEHNPEFQMSETNSQNVLAPNSWWNRLPIFVVRPKNEDG